MDVIYENGEIKSTKTSSLDEHGVGIKNVIKIIEKYDGSYVIEDKNKEFFLFNYYSCMKHSCMNAMLK